MTRIVLFLLIAVAAMALPASAYDRSRGATWDDRYWIKQAVRSQCEWWESCEGRYRYVYKWVRRRPESDAYRRRDGIKGTPGPHCWSALSVVGDASLTSDGARGQAEQSWIREVRWRYGASYSDMTHANNIKWRCGRSSVRSIAGVPLQQTCEVVATPCRAKLQEDDEK